MGFFDDAEESDYKTFVEGYYNIVVTNASVDLTSEPGFVKFEYTVSDQGDFNNRKLWRNFKLDPQGKGRLITDLEKFGVDTNGIGSIDDVASALKRCIGEEASVKVVLNEKKDKPGEFWTNAYLKEVVGVQTLPTSQIHSGVPNHAPQGVDTGEEIPF